MVTHNIQWDCYYHSAAECAPNVIAGQRGFCNVNPYWTGSRVAQTAAPALHRKHRAQQWCRSPKGIKTKTQKEHQVDTARAWSFSRGAIRLMQFPNEIASPAVTSRHFCCTARVAWNELFFCMSVSSELLHRTIMW
jgi:hypothetical protein